MSSFRTALAAISLGFALLFPGPAVNAATLLVQVDDSTEDGLKIYTYRDGVLIQPSEFPGSESYTGGYGLWGQDLNCCSLALFTSSYGVNIFDPDGKLSDTWLIGSTKDESRLTFEFISDVEGQVLNPIDPADVVTLSTIVENGQWQRFLTISFDNLDTYEFEFRSDVSEVPIPAAMPLFASGLAAFGVFARKRGRKVLKAA